MTSSKAKKLTIMFFLILFVVSCSQKPARKNNQAVAIPVKITSVVTESLSLPIRTSGRISSKAELPLSFKIGGIVQKLFAEEGQVVKRGKLLARLNLSEIQAQVNQARSVHSKAVRDLERVQNLYNDKAVTLENVQDARTALEIAAANLRVAEFNLQHARIHAPSTGKILKRFVEANELVGPGMPIFYFGSTDKDWIIRTGLTDRDIVRLALGDPAEVELDAYPDKTFSAEVSEISEAINPDSGLFEIELRVNAGDTRMASGFVATARISPSEQKTYRIIPITSLVEGDGFQGYVFTLEKGSLKAVKKPLKIAHIFEDKVAVSSGLDTVKSVITDGSQYLHDGDMVHQANSPDTGNQPDKTADKQVREDR